MSMKTSYSFRRPDSIQQYQENAVRKLTQSLPPKLRSESVEYLENLFVKWGPVIEFYPAWHPLVSQKPDYGSPNTHPNRCFPSIDHSVLMRNAFITCPYGGAEELLRKVDEIEQRSFCSIEAEAIDIPLYSENATPVLVTCRWEGPLELDELTCSEDAKNRRDGLIPSENGFIPLRYALPLMLELELPNWERAEVAESWEMVKNYIIGYPNGAASSHFLSRNSILILKKQWQMLMDSGAYGPYRDSMRVG